MKSYFVVFYTPRNYFDYLPGDYHEGIIRIHLNELCAVLKYDDGMIVVAYSPDEERGRRL